MRTTVIVAIVVFVLLSIFFLLPAVPVECKACDVTVSLAPDKVVLGRATWTFLHSIVEQYPDLPSSQEKMDMLSIFKFVQFYPCHICKEEFTDYMKKYPVVADTKAVLVDWLCRAHNSVNARLGKPEFDCKLHSIRWKRGL